MFRKIVTLLWVVLPAFVEAAAPAAKPFELWPPTNGEAPAVYAKVAPAFQTDGKAWNFHYGAKVEATIDAARVLRPITPYQFGCNTATWSGKTWFLDPDRIEKAKQSGIRFWRWPGGSGSDNYHWDGNYQNHRVDADGKDPANMNAGWAVSTDDFIQFCKETGSEAIVTVNYGAARYADVKFAADLAARWVTYFNVTKKYKVRYWEIGNEVYGPWEEGNKVNGKPQLTGDVYGKDLRVIAEAMRKVDPDIVIGAVATDVDSGDDWNGFHWFMRDLLPQLQGKADYLILHQYFMWPFDGANNYKETTPESHFANLHKLADAYANTGTMIDKYSPSEKGIPIALTEFNIENASSAPTIELVNGLYMAEVLGESLKSGYVAADYWDWKNGLDAKLRGDHGMLASGDPAAGDATPRPSYYAYALCTRAFGDHLVAATSADPGVKIYASRFSGGEMGLVIVNEDGKNKTLSFNFNGFKPQGRLMGWVLTGKDLGDPQVSWNGEEGPQGGGGPFPIETIPPYRATFKADKPLQLPVQARSVTGIILY